MFENFKTYEFELAGRRLVIETGKMAGLANGSCLVRYGDTAVLCSATASARPRPGIDFLPLSVDFEERLYSVGHIPGSYNRREGRPTDKAILASRVIDRPIRPLFPKDLRNDVNINLTVMSVDPDCSHEIAGMIGASIALSISDIPWNGPIAGVYVGLVDGEIIINPTEEQRLRSDLELTVAGSHKKVVMIEAGAKEVDDDTMFAAIMKAHELIKELCTFIDGIVAEIGKPKFSYEPHHVNEEVYNAIESEYMGDIMTALDTDDKNVRDAGMEAITAKALEKYAGKFESEELAASGIGEILYKLQKVVVRRWLLEDGKRVDGRRLDQIRPLAAEIDLLPRVHGSGMFTRGQTQVLTVCTLGTISEEQSLDGIDGVESKRYMHQYNMPGYSTGEAKPLRSPGRREIGHGALAERALEPVLPSEEDFPYAIRTVSEILSSNGSTSQASVCGSTLALMDAGVPIKAPVAGIAMGLIKDADHHRVAVLSDIQGLEDFLGDMDFKVAGTSEGITAIQMDIKIKGIDEEILTKALEQARLGRLFILDKMLNVLPAPRAELSKWAPKIVSFSIDPDKIRDVIGSGGKTINKIIDETGVKIDINDEGQIFIASNDMDAIAKARTIVENIVRDVEVGDVYEGKVVKIMENDKGQFGASVNFAPGKDGMIHISKLSKERVDKVTDVVNVGDIVLVKVIKIDEKHRVDLRLKEILKKA